MFEFSQLRCFVAIAEELHFSRAAERLSMTQPPLSRQIRLLEDQLGTALLERNSRMVRLTSSGKAFLPEAARILRIAEDAASTARRVAKQAQGGLTVGFTASAGYRVLPQLVRRLRGQAPDVSLTLKEMVSTAQVAALNAGEIDLGLMRPHPVNAELHSKVVASEDLFLAIPAEEAEAWPLQPTLACLHHRPFIMYCPEQAHPFHQTLTERFGCEGVMPDVVEHAALSHTMLALVGAGVGAALVPEGTARLQFEGVITRRVETAPVAMVCTYRHDNDNPVLQLFRKSVLHRCKVNLDQTTTDL